MVKLSEFRSGGNTSKGGEKKVIKKRPARKKRRLTKTAPPAPPKAPGGGGTGGEGGEETGARNRFRSVAREVGLAMRDLDGPDKVKNARTARQGMRAIMNEHGFPSRDDTEKRPLRDQIITKGLPPGLRGGYVPATGKMYLREDVVKGAAGALFFLSDGKKPTAFQVDGLATFIHESIHTSSRLKVGAYEGSTAKIEEVSVELLARKYTKKISKVSTGSRSYQDIINDATGIAQQTLKLKSRAHAEKVLTSAIDKTFKQKGPEFSNSREYAAAIASNIKTTPQQRALFTSALSFL